MSVADIRDTDKIERIDLNTNSSYSKWVFAKGYDNYNYSMDKVITVVEAKEDSEVVAYYQKFIMTNLNGGSSEKD